MENTYLHQDSAPLQMYEASTSRGYLVVQLGQMCKKWKLFDFEESQFSRYIDPYDRKMPKNI